MELAAQDVLFGLQSDLAAMRACLTAPAALQLRWEVDKDGRSTAFETVWSTTNEVPPVECLTRRIRDRRFELPAGADRGLAEWTFVKGLPLDEKIAAKRKRRRNRNGGVKFDPAGALSNVEVDGIVQSGMRLYAHCLRAGVLEDSSMGGRLALAWSVDEDGRASHMTDAGSDLGSQQVVDCAAECFYALRYPRPKTAPVRVTYSLLFNED